MLDRTLYTNRTLLRLLIPLLLEQALFVAVGLADTLMLAHLGEETISGVSLVDALNVIAAVFFAALGTGGAVVTSQFLGAKRREAASASAKQLLWVALLVSLALMPPVYFFRESLFRLAYGELPPGVVEQAMLYFRITVYTYPLMALYMAMAAVFRSMNRSALSMWGAALTNLLNVIGNWLLLFVVHWGVAGAAYSTLFARFAAVIFLGALLRRRSQEVHVRYLEKIHFDWAMIHRIMAIGIPSGIENVIFHFGRLLTTSIVTAFGIVQITANAIGANLASLGCIIGNAFCLGMITVIGQSVGTGSEQTVRYYTRKMMKMAYLANSIGNILVLAFLPLILRCFDSLSPEVCHLLLLILLPYQVVNIIFWPFAFVFPNALRAANDVKFVMGISVSSMLLIRVGLAYFLARRYHIGVMGVWFAMYADWIVRIALFAWRWRSNRWKRHVELH